MKKIFLLSIILPLIIKTGFADSLQIQISPNILFWKTYFSTNDGRTFPICFSFADPFDCTNFGMHSKVYFPVNKATQILLYNNGEPAIIFSTSYVMQGIGECNYIVYYKLFNHKKSFLINNQNAPYCNYKIIAE